MLKWFTIVGSLALAALSASRAGGQQYPARHDTAVPASHNATIEPRPAAGVLTPPAAMPQPLAPPGASTQRGGALGNAARGKSSSGLTGLLTMLGSLIVVLAIFLGVTWVLRRSMPASSQLLPREVVEVLGRTQLAGRQHAHLLRCGNKLVLVALTAGGAETITEITDPVEVDRMSGLCRAAQPQSSTDAFRQIFQQFSRDKSPRGFLGRSGSQTELAAAGSLPQEERDDV